MFFVRPFLLLLHDTDEGGAVTSQIKETWSA